MADTTAFTGILADVAEVAGDAAAAAIAHAKGGLEAVYIPLPGNLAPGHWLVELVGMDKARAIAQLLGGGSVEIPLGASAQAAQRRRVALDAVKRGKSAGEAARMAGCCQRTVRRVKNRVKDERQGELL
jgi:hypothetical protein